VRDIEIFANSGIDLRKTVLECSDLRSTSLQILSKSNFDI